MKITLTKPNEFEVLMEHESMKASAKDADLLTAFNLIAPRFAEATRQKIPQLTAETIRDITAHLMSPMSQLSWRLKNLSSQQMADITSGLSYQACDAQVIIHDDIIYFGHKPE